MKPALFQYARPDTLVQALKLLDEHGASAAVLAGGQSLMPMLNLRVAQPEVLIDINLVPELGEIRRSGHGLSIGGRARHNDVLRSPEVHTCLPLLTQTLTHVAHEAIRNRGTFGGSLALADPAAELPACTVCLGGEIVAASVGGERRIAAGDFFRDIYTTALEANELIVRVEFPEFDANWRFSFDEVVRRHGDFAIVGLALALRCENDLVTEARIVFSGVESAPRRLEAAENCLIGSALTDRNSRTVAIEAARAHLAPVEGGEFPPAYRIHVAGALLDRLVGRLANGAPAQGGH